MPPLTEAETRDLQDLVLKINSGDGGKRALPVFEGTIERAAMDEENMTVAASLSSETKVQRWWGIEVLGHTPEECDLSALRDEMLPLCIAHDVWSIPRPGNVENVRLAGKKLRGDLHFTKTERSEELFQAIRDGVLTDISVGYEIVDPIPEGVDKKTGLTIYRCKWKPREASLVNIGADPAAGIGRSSPIPFSPSAPTDLQVGVERSEVEPTAPTPNGKEGAMPPTEEVRTVAVAPNAPAAPEINVQEVREATRQAEMTRMREISAMGDAWKDHGGPELASEFVKNGRSLDEFRDAMLKRLEERKAVRPAGNPDLGLTDIERQEKKRFSVWNVIRSIAFPDDARVQEETRFEQELCKTFMQKNSRVSSGDGGLVIPGEALRRPLGLRGSRAQDLMAGTGSYGGYNVQTDVLADAFIDLLRNAAPTMGMGTVLSGLTGNVAIPKKTAGSTGYWVAENIAVTDSTIAFGQLAPVPKHVGGYVDLSRLLSLQSSTDIEALVTQDLVDVIGISIDAAAIKGGGSGEPSGILTLPSGIGNVNMGDNSGPLTWAKVVEFEQTTGAANAIRPTGMGWLTNWKVKGAAMAIMRTATYGDTPLWDDRNPGNPLLGYPVTLTNNVPSNYTKGSHGTADLSALIFGYWPDLVFFLWDGLDIARDTAAGLLAGTIRIRVLQSVDIGLRNAASFTISDEISTS